MHFFFSADPLNDEYVFAQTFSVGAIEGCGVDGTGDIVGLSVMILHTKSLVKRYDLFCFLQSIIIRIINDETN